MTKYNRDAGWIRTIAAGKAVEWVRVADADSVEVSNAAQAAVRGLGRTAVRDEVTETGLSGCGLPGVEENADPFMHYIL